MILAVAGGKGGVGKSTVSLNLAAELDAVAVDADLGMADLPESRGPDLHDVLAGRADPVEAVREGGPVDLLSCGRTLAGARAADPTALADAIGAVEDAYGPVVVDCPAGMAADAGLPLFAADRCMLVALPDAFAVADVVRTRALARELDAGLSRVVLNRAGRDPPTDRVERALGAPVTAVPDSAVVERAQRAGKPVTAVAPESTAADGFRELAATLTAGPAGRRGRRR
ncbi:P-loop NTPase [Halostella sp. JP-L12]|uniref:MinD/ParA family ATP-binding protein n=1 Tax=Halostella TaxID=1843185 RepID=UPI000EF84689|nr:MULTISPECIES: MinD/ParA family protein [Halostella]NHN46398.1 P-loop NTPase [Halostella sp. JP-L12]